MIWALISACESTSEQKSRSRGCKTGVVLACNKWVHTLFDHLVTQLKKNGRKTESDGKNDRGFDSGQCQNEGALCVHAIDRLKATLSTDRKNGISTKATVKSKADDDTKKQEASTECPRSRSPRHYL